MISQIPALMFNIFFDIIQQTDLYLLLDKFTKQIDDFDIHKIKQIRKQIKHLSKKHIILHPYLRNVLVCIDKLVCIMEQKNNQIIHLTSYNKILQKHCKQLLCEVEKLKKLKTINGFGGTTTIQVFPE